MGIVTATIMVTIPSTGNFQKTSLKDSTDWYLFLQRMESSNYGFQLINTEKDHLLLYSQTEHRKYSVETGKQAVYFKTERGGYLPILVNYCPDSIEFRQFNEHSVRVKAKLADGKERHAIIIFKKNRQYDTNGSDYVAST